jgi:hypothetical protein
MGVWGTKIFASFCNLFPSPLSDEITTILEELKVEPVDKKLRRYKSNWLRNVTRMKNNRMAKIKHNCRTELTKTT